ncbi:homoserine O-acetyltransferase/O-succinyltransferase family protein [Treponema phagedenis]|uniref:homoserine O-acetyltransferase/O-succinyltransferase family protein n=1 Tax=Treponema phagedenis TaxID=162 RepID=UPI0011E7E1AB|nr:homoserine O-succinyltransferase [Treponema phagedenis]QEK06788.1 homoserine O-succinyltransferase [Treponema phagedenis]
MPLIIPKNLIEKSVLEKEKIFLKSEKEAERQDIRPIQIAIVNLMPKKEETEIQLLRMLSNSALQIKIDLVRMDSYRSKNADAEHLQKFYKTYDEIKNNKYDAMIITGAPVERLEYDSIKYWEELKRIFDFAKANVFSTMFICWSAQAALYYYYNIPSTVIEKKIFGVFRYEKLQEHNLLRGFDDEFFMPQSRYSYVNPESFAAHPDVQVLAHRTDTGVSLAATTDQRFVFSFGHWEYDAETLHKEYLRDLYKKAPIDIPKNYYHKDDPGNSIRVRWRTAGNLFFSNWLNYCVYQETPYDLNEIQKKSVSKFGGSSLSDAKQFAKVKEIILAKEDRDIVVVSAPGKRHPSDTKITDRLIEIHRLKEEVRTLADVIQRLQEDLSTKKDELQIKLTMSKNRFLEIVNDLDLDSHFEQEIDSVFSEIEKSTSKDFVLSRGEYLNAKIMAAYLDYQFIDAKDLIRFDRKGTVNLEKSYRNIRQKIEKGQKVVIPGFYGSDESGAIRIFERGGSDYTGSILARALNSAVYENWTDVDGVMTGDPMKNPNVEKIPHLNYTELTQIIEGGAQIYQREAIEPVKEKNITLKILNTNAPDSEGTEIRDN